MAQSRTMYIVVYTRARKLTCLSLDNLYIMEDSFIDLAFTNWRKIINIENYDFFFKFDEKGILCMAVHGHMVPFYYNEKIGRSTKQCSVSRERFHDVVISVRDNLKEIAKSLSSEIREWFPRDELLESMSIIYPQYWDHSQNEKNLEADFIKKIKILRSHFCREAEIQGEHIQGILDREKMIDQTECFARTMWGQFSPLDSKEYGAITILWTKLSGSEVLRERMSEYFKLADLCRTIILGSVEDEKCLVH